MIKQIFHPMSLILIFVVCLFINITPVKAAKVVCGTTPKGQDLMCDTSTHNCIRCEKHSSPWVFRWIADEVKYTFECINKKADIPRKCNVNNQGGRSGEYKARVFFWTVAKDEGQECVTSNFIAMYTSSCYSCEIIETLASAFIKGAAVTYDVSREAGNVILVVGMIIWIAIFVLKNISSFTTVEPRKMIQDLLIQLFKIYVAFVIVNSGIPTILHYTMEPLMMAGTDFGDAIISGSAPVGGL